MTYLEYKKKYDRVIELAKRRSTGSPKELAQKLEIPNRTLSRMIKNMKEHGVSIAYCKKQQTYYIDL